MPSDRGFVLNPLLCALWQSSDPWFSGMFAGKPSSLPDTVCCVYMGTCSPGEYYVPSLGNQFTQQ